MPLFDFSCQNPECKVKTEVLIKNINEEVPEAIVCPKCGSKSLKCISRCGIKFYGFGWTPKGNNAADDIEVEYQD